MDKRKLQAIERANNQGQADPTDVQELIKYAKELERQALDRLTDDYNRANEQRGANWFGKGKKA